MLLTHAVAAAWGKICVGIKFEDLFRKLGYIWSQNGQGVKLDVLPSYQFDPLLAMPTVSCPSTPAEREKRACMQREDLHLHQLTGVAPLPLAAKPKALKQMRLTFAR